MQRTLHEHITSLELKIAILRAQQDDLGRTAAERYQSAIDLELAEKALATFRKAIQLEQKISDIGMH